MNVRTFQILFKMSYECLICSFQTNMYVPYIDHLQSQEHKCVYNDFLKNVNDNQCYKCYKTFGNKYLRNKHVKRCKGVSNPLQCHICYKIFASSSSKSTHLKQCITSNKNNST